MKKIITILMVLLVTTVVFGAYTPAAAPTATTLDIKTSNQGVLLHKITSVVVNDNATWNNSSANPITEAIPVNIGLTTEQSVAYYSVRTNTKKTVAIEVSATPLATGTDYYIPYKLKVGAVEGEFVGSAGKSAPTFAPISLNASAINTYSNGMRFLSQEITVQFAENYTDSALEGDYESTITFAITATT